MTRETVRWHVLETPQDVARTVARHILRAAHRAKSERGIFRIVLAGGGTPELTYRALAGADTDWTRWSVYFGDERCLPRNDAGRNDFMAARAWLDHVPIPRIHVHPIPAELGAEQAAAEYEQVVKNALPFDLVLLGMGEDGHTASLFPGQEHDDQALVHAVHDAPKRPPDRVTLGSSTLGNAREVYTLVTGDAKRDAVLRWRRGEDLPISRIVGQTGMDVWLDRAAMV